MESDLSSTPRRIPSGCVPVVGALIFLGPFVLEMGPLARALLKPAFLLLLVVGLGFWAFFRRSTSSRGSMAWRIVLASIGLTVLGALGFLIPEWGLLWSPLPWRPQPYHRAVQVLFWILAPVAALPALRLLDLARDPDLRWSSVRAFATLAALACLIGIGVVANAFLWAYLNHGQGG